MGGVVRHPLDAGPNKATALIFIADDCPISNGYAPEINRIVSTYTARKITFYLVNVDVGVSARAVKQHAAAYGFQCPVLLDSGHLLVKRAGATVTPEAAVFGPGGRMLYQGRIDDKYADFGKVRFQPTTHDLRDALDAILAGHPVLHPATKAVGCFI